MVFLCYWTIVNYLTTLLKIPTYQSNYKQTHLTFY
nr:MAG TPA: hypothetical protein [Caudoviricetes sp.]